VPVAPLSLPQKAEENPVRLLTPTENKRLNELIGFLCITLGLLMALALISYSPRDAAFNVSAGGPEGSSARNWIGPAGAYGADLLFQVLGFAAFLLPMALLVLGWRWCRSRVIDSQVATLIGYSLLIVSLPSL
jgi:S-DNA-T family DNA segregation ATPase FtsK/SpoIIIE